MISVIVILENFVSGLKIKVLLKVVFFLFVLNRVSRVVLIRVRMESV